MNISMLRLQSRWKGKENRKNMSSFKHFIFGPIPKEWIPTHEKDTVLWFENKGVSLITMVEAAIITKALLN